MRRLIRQLTSVSVVALLAATAVYGSYKPLYKSHLFYQATENVAHVQTTKDFVTLLSAPLNAPSPTGQEELVRVTAAIVGNLIQREGTPPQVTGNLVTFVNGYFLPVFQRATGIGFAHSLYDVGMINLLAYSKTRESTYLKAAETLFLRGLEASPGRSEFLYGLLDVYRIAQDKEKAKAIAERILTQWPDDPGTRAALAEYLPPPDAQ